MMHDELSSESPLFQNRRNFLRKTALALAGATATALHQTVSAADTASAAKKSTLVGSNIYGWGQYAERDHKKLEIEDVISALRDAGYDYLESFMDLGTPENNAHFA